MIVAQAMRSVLIGVAVSCVVAGDECDRAVAVLHSAFGLDDVR